MIFGGRSKNLGRFGKPTRALRRPGRWASGVTRLRLKSAPVHSTTMTASNRGVVHGERRKEYGIATPPGARVFVISSPSGGGKTTVVNRVLKSVPGLRRSVSVTTRARRLGERQGRDYDFISPSAFQALRRTGRLLEWARVHGARYGTRKQPILDALKLGRPIMLCIDVQGARQVRRALGHRAVLIFLLPPSLTHLRKRLMERRTEVPTVIRRRLAAARQELACAAWYDYRVMNDRLERAVRAVRDIVRFYPSSSGHAEHLRGGVTSQPARRGYSHGAGAD